MIVRSENLFPHLVLDNCKCCPFNMFFKRYSHENSTWAFFFKRKVVQLKAKIDKWCGYFGEMIGHKTFWLDNDQEAIVAQIKFTQKPCICPGLLAESIEP